MSEVWEIRKVGGLFKYMVYQNGWPVTCAMTARGAMRAMKSKQKEFFKARDITPKRDRSPLVYREEI